MKPAGDVGDDEITPKETYFGRRALMRGGIIAASAVATGLAYRRLNATSHAKVDTKEIRDIVPAEGVFRVDEPMTSLDGITHYNNFYEFTTDKDGVADAAAGFKTAGWQLEVTGLVAKPRVFDMDALRALAPTEERIYRMRCVEAWSMVIPWAGFSLKRLLDEVQPLGSAKFVAFETLVDPSRMPGQRDKVLDWPYREGLRLDEAMHPLTLLATGLYGRELPAQDGAPVRLVVPWKYGFKGAKSLVKISLVEEQPITTWGSLAPREYGFYANVNPTVDHPRWSQATEERIGEDGRRATLMFNGYEKEVASLYEGMDLRVHY